ncbi:Uncharacterised protein [Yersinia enterocolitica]|nr:Uncharacterised protein [Yersinia enterocolitica]CND53926.1 Uncharacterised protein [Yersinia enterocolitica]CNE11771.1 Uncharacterised protein [Yersinia enterocolitica]CNI11132.1 Uncharacterised protein [Yersinia enterocolitica]CNJ91726.1 Uncharacterised protein [Yersinia enterocolitica]
MFIVIIGGIFSPAFHRGDLLQLMAGIPLQRLTGLQLLLITGGIKLTANIRSCESILLLNAVVTDIRYGDICAVLAGTGVLNFQ